MCCRQLNYPKGHIIHTSPWASVALLLVSITWYDFSVRGELFSSFGRKGSCMGQKKSDLGTFYLKSSGFQSDVWAYIFEGTGCE